MACTVGLCCARVKTLGSRSTDCLSRAVTQIGNYQHWCMQGTKTISLVVLYGHAMVACVVSFLVG